MASPPSPGLFFSTWLGSIVPLLQGLTAPSFGQRLARPSTPLALGQVKVFSLKDDGVPGLHLDLQAMVFAVREREALDSVDVHVGPVRPGQLPRDFKPPKTRDLDLHVLGMGFEIEENLSGFPDDFEPN